MSDTFEPFDTPPGGGPHPMESADLPAPLAAVQQRLQQFRPRQPQLDLALLERLATGNHVAPLRVAAGFSKLQLALAVAAAWLCGVIFGAALLLGIGYRSSATPAPDQLAAGDAHAPAAVAEQPATAGIEAANGGTAAESETPLIAVAETPAVASPVQERTVVVAVPEERKATPTSAGGVSRDLARSSVLDWDSPLRANSLRMQRGQQVFVHAYPGSTGAGAARSPANQSPGVAPAISASDSGDSTDISAPQLPLPKTRQQWMNDLLATPPTELF